jgi:hypothetical protein
MPPPKTFPTRAAAIVSIEHRASTTTPAMVLSTTRHWHRGAAFPMREPAQARLVVHSSALWPRHATSSQERVESNHFATAGKSHARLHQHSPWCGRALALFPMETRPTDTHAADVGTVPEVEPASLQRAELHSPPLLVAWGHHRIAPRSCLTALHGAVSYNPALLCHLRRCPAEANQRNEP